MTALLVFLGGGMGSVLRYLVQLSCGSLRGTLIVNLVGSFFIGYVVEKFAAREQLRMFLAPGLLGGFTTFSAFSYETWKTDDPMRAGAYVLISVVGAITLCALGAYLASAK